MGGWVGEEGWVERSVDTGVRERSVDTGDWCHWNTVGHWSLDAVGELYHGPDVEPSLASLVWSQM